MVVSGVAQRFDLFILACLRTVFDNTQHTQQVNNHAPGGIRTHNLSKRVAEDLRLRPRGHWDRQGYLDADRLQICRSETKIHVTYVVC